jgi:hypothetical protein
VIVDVIFPCLNEASALPWIFDRMPAGFRPIVVDNCPTDGPGGGPPGECLAGAFAAVRGPALLVGGRDRLVRRLGPCG